MRLSKLLREYPDAHLVRGSADLPITGVCEDSRRVEPGNLFVAVNGTTTNGTRFVPDALRRGAVAVATEAKDELQLPDNIARLAVRDGRAAASGLASALLGHPARSLCAVGVTGTNGKTTTSTLIQQILAAAGHPTGLLGTVGYDVGGELRTSKETTPGGTRLMSYLAAMRDNGLSHVSMEVSSHALDQRRTAGIKFRVGVLTNITADHLEYHGGFDAYRDAKALLFEGLRGPAFAVLNDEDPSSDLIEQLTEAQVIRYGTNAGDVRGQILDMSQSGTRFNLVFPNGSYIVRLPMIGWFNVQNALAAASATWALGVDISTIACALEQTRGVGGRLERVDVGQPFGVLVDYAHTEDALVNVLKTLRPLVKGKLIVVFGCGGDRDRSKRPRMGRAVRAWADVAVITSDNPRSEEPRAILREIQTAFVRSDEYYTHVDRGMAIRTGLDRASEPEDLVLIAGKGHEDYQEFRGGRRVPFDDRTVARNALMHRIKAAGECTRRGYKQDPPPSLVSTHRDTPSWAAVSNEEGER